MLLERVRKTKEALGMWKRFLLVCRVKERVERYDVEGEEDEQKHAGGDAGDDNEDMGAGGITPNSTTEPIPEPNTNALPEPPLSALHSPNQTTPTHIPIHIPVTFGPPLKSEAKISTEQDLFGDNVAGEDHAGDGGGGGGFLLSLPSDTAMNTNAYHAIAAPQSASPKPNKTTKMYDDKDATSQPPPPPEGSGEGTIEPSSVATNSDLNQKGVDDEIEMKREKESARGIEIREEEKARSEDVNGKADEED